MRTFHRRGSSARINVFFFNDTATTEIYTLSLHDALPIWPNVDYHFYRLVTGGPYWWWGHKPGGTPAKYTDDCGDRKSTRLNSSHANISYAVFCLKKNKRDLKRDSSRRTTADSCVYAHIAS